MKKYILALLVTCVSVLAVAQNAAELRIRLLSATPSEQTGQDYSPWLNDNLNSLVADAWQGNFKYVDVTLRLERKCQLTRLALYDYQGVFTDQPALIYALNGTQRTFLGSFTGADYLQWVEIRLASPVTADALVIHKYCNNIPQKINVFGIPNDADPTVVVPPSSAPAANQNITLDARRWYQVNNTSNGLEGLFDGKTNERVHTGWGKILTNYDAYYPLETGEELTLKHIRFYDGEGTNVDEPMTLSVIDDKWQRIPIARFTGSQYNAWVGPDPSQPADFAVRATFKNARYLVLNTSGAYPTEIELYGTLKAADLRRPARSLMPTIPLRQLFGVNAFEWDIEDARSPWQVDESRLRTIKAFSAMRHYMDWEKLESQPGQYTFNPTLSGSWNYDAMYERLRAEGVEVLACLKTIPRWLEETYPSDQRDNENTPARYGTDLTSPRSYAEQARVGFQYMARYGYNRNVDRSLVRVSSITTWAGTNTVRIGMGLIRYIECDNERDKTWKDRKAYQTAREYAANLSAFYDGHKNTLGPDVGVKNADPNVKVVIGGLAASSTDYVRAMIDWCREFRGYKANGEVNLCWDIINQHLYANDAHSSQSGGASRGAAPEVSGVGEQAAAFVEMARQYAGNMPVWITEAGYDVNQGSPFKAIAIGSKSVLETHADWTLRTALTYSRVGIDRLFFYQLYDDNPTAPVQFSSMGLLNPDKTRKPAGDYLYQTHKLLGAYSYKQTLNRDPMVDRYELNGRPAYVLVIPDERGRTGSYTLSVGDAATVQVYTPKIGSDDMVMATLACQNGKVTLTVSETPIFVIPAPVQGARASAEEVDKSLATVQVYPNPTTDYLDVSLENGNNAAVELKLYDGGLGRLHQQSSLPKPGRRFSERLDVRLLPHGLYMLEVQQGQERAVRKVIKVH